MVQRFSLIARAGVGLQLEVNPHGIWVEYENYLALRAALREALNNWRAWNDLHDKDEDREHEIERIAALRAQFLDDK